VRSFRAAGWISLAVVLAYGWVVGGDASVSRAVTVASLYLLCGLVGLRPDGLAVLGTAAVWLTVATPRVVIDPGAWLSFGATVGIIAAFAHAGHAQRPAAERRVVRLLRPLSTMLVATLSAELAVLPVSASVFTRVGIAGLVLNFVAIPMMAVVQLAGLAAVLLAGLWPWAAHLGARLADLAARLLVNSSRLVDVAPWLSWRVPPPSLGLVVIFYGGALWWLAGRGDRRRRRLAPAVVFGLSTLAIATAPASTLAAPSAGRLRVTMIDVGQGDALAVQLPTGQSLLVDAGGANGGFDVGDRVVTRALWALGVRRLDWLVFTHADLDHIGGALSVAQVFAPREIWEGVPVPSDPKRQALHDWAEARRVPWRVTQTGDRIEAGPLVLEVLHPPRPDWERQRVRNDDSVVLRVRYGEVELLLTGDVEGDVEPELTPVDADGPPAPLRVLKVAHHGSRTSTSGGFVQAYAPAVALVSVGRGNLFGHPSPDVLARLDAAGVRVFRTDVDGAITVETDGRSLDVEAMSGRTWRARVWRAPS
jgi:competence protein ComEC